MTTIKSYTDIEQSKKLAEILPIESADMRYTPFGDTHHPWVLDEEVKLLEKDSVPCWSLAALLNVIPIWYDIHPTKSHVAIACDYGKEVAVISDNLVDACYEMIIKLHELNLL